MKAAIRSRPFPLHQMRCECSADSKVLAIPVGLEALDDFVDLVRVRGDDGVVARLGQVLGLPVERLDERRLVVDHHRLLVREVERRIAVDHLDSSGGECLPRVLVLFFAAAASRIQHDAHLHAAGSGGDHGLEQFRIGEDEHLDSERFLGAVDGIENRLGGVVGQNNQRAGHIASRQQELS